MAISDYRAELYTRLVIAHSRKQTRKSRVKRNPWAAKTRDKEVCHRVHMNPISSFRNSHSSVISIGNRIISNAISNKFLKAKKNPRARSASAICGIYLFQIGLEYFGITC